MAVALQQLYSAQHLAIQAVLPDPSDWLGAGAGVVCCAARVPSGSARAVAAVRHGAPRHPKIQGASEKLNAGCFSQGVLQSAPTQRESAEAVAWRGKPDAGSWLAVGFC